MYVRKMYVFKTPFYEPKYKEFYSVNELTKFLQNFDFMQPHEVRNFSAGLPEFQIGAKISFSVNGNFCESDVLWGPKFLAGRCVHIVDKKVFAFLPMDKISDDKTNFIGREYKPIQIRPGLTNAVIDLATMRQLWPNCHKKVDTELTKFFLYIAKKKYYIKPR